MISEWNWPQVTLASMMGLSMLVVIFEDKLPEYSGMDAYRAWRIADMAVMVFLLYAGGFWK